MPIYQSRSEEISDVLIENVISKYCVSEYMKMDQDSAFMLTLINYLFNRHDIKIKIVGPYNHQSLQVEHGMKSLSNILTKPLTDHRQMWPNYLPPANVAYNTFDLPNVSNYSPYKLVFGRKTKCF